jgi:tRNA (guanine-N7-)-methyltransferase
VFDIGIGLGDALMTAAAAEPEIDVIGADVHTPGIASTLARIESMNLTHVRLVHGDALRFAERLAPGSLAGIRAFFPDPWHKARHRDRRLATAANVERFAALLAPGGTLHVATDIVEYATQVARLCSADGSFEGGPVPRPVWRPETRYERRGLDAGRTVGVPFRRCRYQTKQLRTVGRVRCCRSGQRSGSALDIARSSTISNRCSSARGSPG